MSQQTSPYPERVYSSSEEGKWRQLRERLRPEGISPAVLIGGLAVLGLGLFAVYKFGPDFVRYLKMERM
jgi:hypothetical protein